MVSKRTATSTSTPAAVARTCPGLAERGASSPAADTAARSGALTSNGCSVAAASAGRSAAAPNCNDTWSVIECSVGLSFTDADSCSLGPPDCERPGKDVEAFATRPFRLAVASARPSEVGFAVDVNGSRFGDSAWRNFKPSGPRNQQRRLAARSTREYQR